MEVEVRGRRLRNQSRGRAEGHVMVWVGYGSVSLLRKERGRSREYVSWMQQKYQTQFRAAIPGASYSLPPDAGLNGAMPGHMSP